MTMIILAQKKRSQAEVKLQKVETDKQREISENTLRTQESERQQLGLELHDDLGPSFSAARLFVQQIEQKVNAKEYDDIPQITQTVTTTLNDAIQKFSDVSRVLYPSALHRLGLMQALQDIIDRCNQISDGSMVFCLDTSLKGIDKEIIALSIYRLIQELSNNAIKHSKASSVQFTLTENESHIYLHYADDGVGFNIYEKFNGLGMSSIRGRVEALGGDLDMKSEKDNGLVVAINIPKSRD